MAWKLDQKRKMDILLGLFIAALVAANLIGTKIADLVIFSASVGIFSFPITFLVTDIVAEVKGREKAQNFVYAGFVSMVLVFILVALSVWLPPASRFELNAEYIAVLNPSLRIIAASMIAFLISQTHDIWAFDFWKSKTKGRFLWFRNNASTFVSQFIDTTIFMFIAFYMVTPKFTADFIFALIIPYWLIKLLVAVIDTPFVYAGARWLRGK